MIMNIRASSGLVIHTSMYVSNRSIPHRVAVALTLAYSCQRPYKATMAYGMCSVVYLYRIVYVYRVCVYAMGQWVRSSSRLAIRINADPIL